MHSITDKQRIEKARTLRTTFDHLYSAPESGAVMSRIYDKYQLPPQQYLTYSRIVGDVILGFLTTAQLPKLLETELGIDEATAIAIVEDLREFLAPVYDRENGRLPAEPEPEPSYEEQAHEAAAPADTLRKANPEWNIANTSAHTDDATTPPATPDRTEGASEETAMETIAPMRTMEGDIQKIHGYGAYRTQFPRTAGETGERVVQSTQADTLTRRAPTLAETPKIEDPDDAT